MKKLAALLAVLLLCMGCVHAEFAPDYREWAESDPAAALVTAELFRADGLSDESLGILNGWLSRTTAVLTRDGFGLILDGTTVLRKTLTGGDAAGSDGTDAQWPAFMGALSAERTAEALLAALPEFYFLLQAEAEPRYIKDGIAVENAVTPSSYEQYSLSGEALTRCVQTWAARYSVDIPLAVLLQNGVFTGDNRVRRLLDKDGADMGLQWTGETPEGKGSLLCGLTKDRGGTFSLKLPGLTVVFGGRLRVSDGDVRSLSVSGSVRQSGRRTEWEGTLRRDASLHTTGKFTLTDTQNGHTDTWTVKPDLSGLSGTVALTRKTGGSVTLDAAVSVTLTCYDTLPGDTDTLTRAFYALLKELDPSQRARLAHEMRTDAAMDAPVPAVPGPDVSFGDDTIEWPEPEDW